MLCCPPPPKVKCPRACEVKGYGAQLHISEVPGKVLFQGPILCWRRRFITLEHGKPVVLVACLVFKNPWSSGQGLSMAKMSEEKFEHGRLKVVAGV